jgi:glycosyltransferase involved in cell wall biosynthesis
LSEKCEITLVALDNAIPDSEAMAALQPYCRSVHTVVRPGHPRLFPPRLAPPAVFLDDVPELRQTVQMLQTQTPFDILQIEYPSLAQYLAYRQNSVTLLTELDVSYLSCYRRFRLERSWPLKIRRFLGFVTFFYYELRHLPRFDTVIAMSDYDRQVLQRWSPRLPVEVIPNGVDCTHFVPRPQPASTEKTLLFVGNFRHPPNVDAALFLLKQVWPELMQAVPTLRLIVVGPEPPPEVRAAANTRLIVTGRVADVREYYAQADGMVVPLRYGSGTRLKILEAFAAGVPVISTPLGIEGIKAEPERHFLKAETPQAFVRQIERLLSDLTLGEQLARNARGLVEAHYDWKALAGRQLEVYLRPIQSRRF